VDEGEQTLRDGVRVAGFLSPARARSPFPKLSRAEGDQHAQAPREDESLAPRVEPQRLKL
jgi:hypothetical protein